MSSVRTCARRIPASLSVRLVALEVGVMSTQLHANRQTGQVGKILGERWKALNDKQRAPYEAKAAADKKRYEDEKQAYNVSSTAPVTPASCGWP